MSPKREKRRQRCSPRVTRSARRSSIVDRLPNLAWERIPESDQGIEPVAKMMVSSLPTEVIDGPPVGACFTARGLAAWRGVTRQALYQQRQAGSILDFAHDRVVAYPAFQFSDSGRTLPVVRDLFTQLLAPLTDAAAVAVWPPQHGARIAMTAFETLPIEPGRYRIDTTSGTVHIIDNTGRICWERRPSLGSMRSAYDNQSVVLSILGPGWHVGGQGYLEVSDETYLTGKTWHLTSTITSIADERRP